MTHQRLVHGPLVQQGADVLPVSGTYAWFDASDASTITESGGAVSGWDDKSGNGRDLTQVTAGEQPTTNATTQNGKNVIDFDGTEWLEASSATVFDDLHKTDDTWTAFVVYNQTNATNGTLFGNSNATVQHGVYLRLLDASGWTDSAVAVVTRGVSGNASALAGPATAGNYSGSHVAGSWQYAAARCDLGSNVYVDRLQLNINGYDNIFLHSGGARSAYIESASNATNAFQVGASGGDVTPFTGSIAEIVIYPTALSDSDYALVEDYLITKWGLSTPATFSPTAISGLACWYDASDESSITESSGAVSQWNDLSGNGNHATAESSNPTTGTRTMNGLNALDFDGTDDRLTTNYSSPTGPVTLFVMFSSDSGTGNDRLLSTYDGSGALTAGEYVLDLNASTRRARFLAGTVTSTQPTLRDSSTGTNAVVSAVSNTNGTLVRQNMQDSFDTSAGTGHTTAVLTDWRIGEDTTTGGEYFDGLIAEVLIYAADLSISEIQQVESYLVQKWAGNV